MQSNGHHLGMIAQYVYNVYGKDEKRFLKGYFRENVDKVRQLYQDIIDGAKINVVEGPEGLYSLCHPDHHWNCRDEEFSFL